MQRRLLVLSLALALPASASAHGISGQCLAHADRVTVQAYFDTNEPAAGAEVRVLNEQKQEVAAGKTDDSGAWTFPNPGKGRYRVLIDAGGEHRAEVKLVLTDDRYDTETQASTGPGRSAFTGFKLGKIVAGLVAIAVFAVLLRLMLRRRSDSTPSPVQ